MFQTCEVILPKGSSELMNPETGRQPFFFLDRFGRPYHIVKCRDGYYRHIDENGFLDLDEVLCESHGYFHEVSRKSDGTVLEIIIPTSC